VWLVLALATPATLLALLIKRGSRWLLVRRLAPSMVVGFLAGGSAVLMGYMSSLLWRTTGETTLWTSRWALSQFVDDIVYDPHALVLGTSSFSVQIAPICSGFEGMGLIAAILGGYIFIHRKTLRFPIVLAVIPVAVVTVWLFNIARIAALILIGTYGWQEVAVGGFHSRAGWIAFCVVAIAFIALLQRSRLFSVQALDAPLQQTEEASNVTPYVLPLMVLIAASLLTGLFAEAVDMLYPVRVVVAVVCLLALRTSYKGLIVRLNMSNVVVGLAVYGLWVATVPPASDSGDFLYGSLLEMKAPARVVWIVMRVFGSTLIVPIVEELAFRGYLLRRLTARNFEAVSYANVAWLPLVGSSLVFGSLHGHLLAGTIAGLLFGLVQARGGRIGDAIAAHAIANGLIAMQVLFLSHWGWWG